MAAQYSIDMGGGDQLEMRVSPWTGTKLFHNAQQLKRGWFSSRFKLTGVDGKEHEVRLQNNFFDSLPKLILDGTVKAYAPPLPTWAFLVVGGAYLQVVVSVLLVGGPVGAIPGLVAAFYAQNAIRGNEDANTGAMMAIGYVVLAWVVWAIFAFVVLALLISSS
jgi:hypothetical protein